MPQFAEVAGVEKSPHAFGSQKKTALLGRLQDGAAEQGLGAG
jgi:hypothetical protein